MTDTRYNGWRNYDTWLANLWLDNSRDMNDEAEEHIRQAIDDDNHDAESARKAAAESMAGSLESEFDEQAEEIQRQIGSSGFFIDVINGALREVDWREIAENHINDVPLWSAGWNMPGYLPDSDPALFMEHSDAQSYLESEIGRAIDEDAEQENVTTATEHGDAATQAIARLNATKGEFGETIGKYHYWVAKV